MLFSRTTFFWIPGEVVILVKWHIQIENILPEKFWPLYVTQLYEPALFLYKFSELKSMQP